MMIGEKVVIERLESGLYKITVPEGQSVVGGAASTALSLNSVVFMHEAMEIGNEHGPDKK